MNMIIRYFRSYFYTYVGINSLISVAECVDYFILQTNYIFFHFSNKLCMF